MFVFVSAKTDGSTQPNLLPEIRERISALGSCRFAADDEQTRVPLAPLETPYAAALASDFLQYLDGAAGLRLLDDGHHTFALDGERLARAARAEMQDALQESGRLPIGVELATSTAVASVTGSGEPCHDDDRLPRRMVLDLKQPAVSPYHDARAYLVVGLAGLSRGRLSPKPEARRADLHHRRGAALQPRRGWPGLAAALDARSKRDSHEEA
jgi:hypothetical protein